MERVKLHTGKTPWGGGGVEESEGTPVNVLNKELFWYTGFQYTLLLVDYDTFSYVNTRALAALVSTDMKNAKDEECKMEGERHICYRYNADIEATNNNAINHFLYVKSLTSRKFAWISFAVARTFFLKISKSVACKSLTSTKSASRTRPGRMLASLPSLTLCLISASFQTFCLTASAYLNTQKYGLFYSVRQCGRKVWDH